MDENQPNIENDREQAVLEPSKIPGEPEPPQLSPGSNGGPVSSASAFEISVPPANLSDENLRTQYRQATYDRRALDDLTDLAKAVEAESYSPAVYKNNHRSKANFERTHLLAFDFDNVNPEETYPLAEAVRSISDLAHVVHTTKSHGKPKASPDKKYTTSADRFRVILKTETAITDGATYEATYDEVIKRYGWKIDKAGRDFAHTFDPGPVHSCNPAGLPVPVIPPTPSDTTKAQDKCGSRTYLREAGITDPSLALGTKGNLRRDTWGFIEDGSIPEGAAGRNEAWRDCCLDLKSNHYTREEALAFAMNLPALSNDFLEDEVTRVVASVYDRPDYGTQPPRGVDSDTGVRGELRNLILDSDLICEITDRDTIRCVNVCQQRIIEISRPNLKKLLGRVIRTYHDESGEKVKVTEYHRLEQREEFAVFEYNPHIGIYSHPNTGKLVFNPYIPPSWKVESHFRNQPIPSVDSPPSVFDAFLTHLTAGDAASKDYIYDWLATALHSRNLTYLTAIGDQGVGKGLLGEIMRKLVGLENFARVRDEVFKHKFNGQLANKQIAFFDEVNLKDQLAMNKMKDLCNDYIEIECKGKDARQVRNHLNSYVAANDFDALGRIPPDDRRFSIVNITDQRFRFSDLRNRIPDLLSDETINDLARYLWQRRVERPMDEPFKSNVQTKMNYSNCAEWERWLITEYASNHIGQDIPLQDVQVAITRQFENLKAAPGRPKIEDLAKTFPDIMHVRQSSLDRARRVVRFAAYLDDTTFLYCEQNERSNN